MRIPMNIALRPGTPAGTPPSIASSIFVPNGTASDPQDLSTSGLSWSTGQVLMTLFGASGAITMTSVAGLTNDTFVEKKSALITGARGYLHQGTVVGGALDATIRFDLSGTRRCVAGMLSIAGSSGLDANASNPASDTGTDAPIVAPAFTITSGNCLIIACAISIGAHVTNPPQAPSGYTLLGTSATTTNNPSSSVHSTIAIAYKTQISAGSVAAATFGGWADYPAGGGWATIHFALKP